MLESIIEFVVFKYLLAKFVDGSDVSVYCLSDILPFRIIDLYSSFRYDSIARMSTVKTSLISSFRLAAVVPSNIIIIFVGI